MSYVAKDKDVDAAAPAAKIHKIRITLTSRNVKNLEKGECLESCWCYAGERTFRWGKGSAPYEPCAPGR